MRKPSQPKVREINEGRQDAQDDRNASAYAPMPAEGPLIIEEASSGHTTSSPDYARWGGGAEPLDKQTDKPMEGFWEETLSLLDTRSTR